MRLLGFGKRKTAAKSDVKVSFQAPSVNVQKTQLPARRKALWTSDIPKAVKNEGPKTPLPVGGDTETSSSADHTTPTRQSLSNNNTSYTRSSDRHSRDSEADYSERHARNKRVGGASSDDRQDYHLFDVPEEGHGSGRLGSGRAPVATVSRPQNLRTLQKRSEPNIRGSEAGTEDTMYGKPLRDRSQHSELQSITDDPREIQAVRPLSNLDHVLETASMSTEALEHDLPSPASQPPMMVVPFEAFSSFGRMPRSSDRRVLVPYNAIANSRHKSFVVFVSHAWCRTDPNPSLAHPDTARYGGLKHRLVVDAVGRMRNLLPPGVQVYLWIDYACIDQDNSKRQLSQTRTLQHYMGRCDALLTPYVTEAATGQTPEEPVSGSYPNAFSGACAWADRYEGLQLFCARGWCRLEMMLATRVPLPPDGFNLKFRHFGTQGGKFGGRPHFVFGDHQRKRGGIDLLPRLPDSWFSNNPPAQGDFTYERDRAAVAELTAALLATDISELDTSQYRTCQEPIPLPVTLTPLECQADPRLSTSDSAKGFGARTGSAPSEEGSAFPGSASEDQTEGERPSSGRLSGGDGMEEQGGGSGRRLHGRWSEQMINGDSYEGEWRDGKRHGKGTYHFADGAHYVGQWKSGMWHGQGAFHGSDGRTYTGGWKLSKRHGQGVLEYADGSRYKGQWYKGKRCGQGTMTEPDGSAFRGEWRDGMRNGYGTYESRRGGFVYRGEWRDDKPTGKGAFCGADGSRYSGEVVDGAPHGCGTMTYPDGEMYTGDWLKDRPSGQGKFIDPYGAWYEGAWVAGLPEGQGTYCSAEGKTYTGTWVKGVLAEGGLDSGKDKPADREVTLSAASESGARELEGVLTDPIKRRYLQAFMEKTLQPETLRFHLRVRGLKQRALAAGSDARRAACLELADDFVREGGLYEIDISDDLRENTLNSARTGAAGAFDGADSQMFRMLQAGGWANFLESDECREMDKALQDLEAMQATGVTVPFLGANRLPANMERRLPRRPTFVIS